MARGDNTARKVGAVAGFVLSAMVMLYLELQKRPAEPARPVTRPATVAALPRREVELNTLAAQQAAEIARLKLAADAEQAVEQLREAKPVVDAHRPELARFGEMSPKELHGEIQMAATDAANYAAEDSYAPDAHDKLYRSVNILWDIRGLSDDENTWLRQSVNALNEMAVRHAQESFEDGDDAAVVRVAKSFGDWMYRLSDDQEHRLTLVLEQAASRLRSGK